MIEFNGIQIVYGFYDISPEEGDFLAGKFGFRNLNDALSNWVIGDANLYVGYHTLDVANGEECLIFGYFVDMIDSKSLNDSISDEKRKRLLDYRLQMDDMDLRSPFLNNGLGYILLKDMPPC